MEKLIINLHEYDTQCADGCCIDYGTVTTVNGVELQNHNPDSAKILQQVLEHLGYKVEITETYYFEGNEDN